MASTPALAPAQASETTQHDPTWLCGKPGPHHTRTTLHAPTRDAAAFTYARRTYQSATVHHTRQGWYDVTVPEFEWDHTPCTFVQHFRVARAPTQARRGVDEGAARRALMALHPAGWAVPEINITAADGYAGRADLFVLPDHSGSIGYEIKTDRDSLSRLTSQIRLYDHCFSRRVLATTPSHLKAAGQLLTQAWGLVVLDPVTHEILEQHRAPQAQEHDLASQLLVLEELRVGELNALLREIGVTRTNNSLNAQRWALLEAHYGIPTLRDLCFRTLAARTGRRVIARRLASS
ncbi:sce7726 family protein [Deinococcus sp. HMF7604]|uniref:sce7726 family protein n=1 Tax=Deinococcus betulae TaxID=2873312 RepID=UPI001CCCB9E8|nr:sce7726 family protein [Deinococcus betulae]MBZ9753533.1 sce7726 family protein [Deinococcus betulae]